MNDILWRLIFVASFLCSWPARGEDVFIPAAGQSSTGPKLFVVTIAVASFSDSFWQGLKWPLKDGEAVAQQIGMGIKRPVVVRGLRGEKATLLGVRKLLTDLEREVGPDDQLVLYVSTHGTIVARTDTSFEPSTVLYDSNHDRVESTTLTHSELRQRVDAMRSRHKAVILATCHSGFGKSRLTPDVQTALLRNKGDVEDALERDGDSEGALILTAAARGETALEDDRLGGDVYTSYLLEGLKAGDRNQDGAVSVIEAHDYAREHTIAFTKGKQRPTLEAKLIGKGDFALAGREKGKGLPVVYGYDPSLNALAAKSGTRSKTGFPGAMVLSRGKNVIELIEVASEEVVGRIAVVAGDGEQIDVRELLEGPRISIGIGPALITPPNGDGLGRVSGGIFGPGLAVDGIARLGGESDGVGSVVGLHYRQFQTGHHPVRNGIDGRVEARSVGISLGLAKSLSFRQSMSLSGVVSRDSYRLELEDKNGRASSSDDATSMGAGFLGRWQARLPGQVWAGVELGRYWSRADFGATGRMDAQRWEVGVQAGWLLGGRGEVP